MSRSPGRSMLPRRYVRWRARARWIASDALNARARALSVCQRELTEKEKEIARLRAAEKFITRETGEYECRVCSYTYVPSKGDGRDFGPGTQFRDLPQGTNGTRVGHSRALTPPPVKIAGWRCPACRSQKGVFEPMTQTIAGFADNQQYGFGGNSMTSEQKVSSLLRSRCLPRIISRVSQSVWIFGGLAAFFLLFLSGYLME